MPDVKSRVPAVVTAKPASLKILLAVTSPIFKFAIAVVVATNETPAVLFILTMLKSYPAIVCAEVPLQLTVPVLLVNVVQPMPKFP